MITLTGGGVTIYVNADDAAFYMRLGYVVVNHEKHEPLPASPFVPVGKNGEEDAAPAVPTVKRRKK
jgi:hypothetical protein